MNLSARIKNSKTRPNYILNVNINIPLRPNNMEPYRPVSGQFSISPSHRNKKLKLQIPSARTTNECESRKISYLGQTQNTISYRNQGNRKKTTKSAFPTEHISKMFNTSNQLAKSKNQFRSEAVSPNAKKISTNKKMKISSMNQIVKGKELVKDFFTQSEDNIIGYTNQSSELERISRDRSRRVNEGFQLQEKDIINIKNIKFKSQSPLLEQQKGLIYGIRQFQKSAQLKKQHLNYEYLKQKVLVLASVKKIQRAWRNYKTKKLIKSYSNNISLKFTGKLKNKKIQNKESEQNKILTVRSCGFSGQYNDFKKQIKKNLSQLYPKQQQEQEQYQEEQEQEKEQGNMKENWQQQNKKKLCQVYSARDSSRKSQEKDKQFDGKSAVVKFQMEEIRRWEELISHIRQGKKVDEVLQKSFRRKQELEKQLSDNLKQMENLDVRDPKQEDADQMGMHNNEGIASSTIQKDSQKIQQTLNNIPNNFDTKQHKVISIPSVPSVSSQISVSSQQQNQIKLAEEYSPSILSMQKKQLPIDADKSCFEQSEEGATTQRRRQKLQYFQNQLRKIDNQYSESNLSKSHHSESELITLSPEQIHLKNFNRETEEEENNKLKRKIQAMARIKMFEQNEQDHQIEDEKKQEKEKNTYLYTSLQRVPDRKTKKVEKNKDEQQSQQNDYFPLTVKRNNDIKDEVINKDVENDRLQTFRKKASQEISHNIIYEDLENLRLKNLKKKKFTWTQKQELSLKIEEEIFYDLLLQFSQKEKFISKMETLYVRNSQQMKKQQEIEKPEGICTNLESIKDYLQNFVAFAFEQQPTKLLQGFNSPKGPNTQSLLKMFNRNVENDHKIYRVLSDELFDHHWDYASEQIYFDAKYPNDAVKQQQRVKYLKSITKMYFKAIFDGFNECLETYRVYGLQGKCYPWQMNLSKKNIILNIQQIKPLIRMGYRKLSQIAIIYCGLLFQDKKHNMSLKMIEQIQKQRLDTLVEIELQDEQHKWNSIRIERASTIYNTSKKIWQALVAEACEQILRMNFFK